MTKSVLYYGPGDEETVAPGHPGVRKGRDVMKVGPRCSCLCFGETQFGKYFLFGLPPLFYRAASNMEIDTLQKGWQPPICSFCVQLHRNLPRPPLSFEG